MLGETAMYILSFFIISLGGISLFIQKIYKLDKKGGQTVVDLPFLGKLTTNYPALAFVFIGAAMAIFAFSRASVAGANSWFVTGQFTAPPSKNVDWQSGSIVVDPKIFRPTIYPDGTFQIEGNIRKGEKFEDEAKQITYQNQHFLGSIKVEDEYFAYKKDPSASTLSSMSNTGRTYKPVEVTQIDHQ